MKIDDNLVIKNIHNNIGDKPCDLFDFNNLEKYKHSPEYISDTLVKALEEHKHKGYGISACQLKEFADYQYRVFAMMTDPILVCFNPKIIDTSTENIYQEESCLSFPKFLVKVKRPKSIKIRFADINGNVSTHVFIGMTARIFQHELDHLNGLMFYKDLNNYYTRRALRKMKILSRRCN